jgi:hypothetical protein
MIENDTFNFINTDRYNAALEKGITFIASAYIYELCSSLPNDLSEYAAKFEVKESYASLTNIFQCTLDNDRVEIQSDRGVINFILSAEDTESLPVGRFVYEITITSIEDIVFRLARGKFDIVP